MRTVKLPSGERIPVLGQGTWHLAEVAARRDTEILALRRGLDLGMTVIDTAEMYADGEAEKLVGEAIAGRRDEVFLVSKVLPHMKELTALPGGPEVATDQVLYNLSRRGPELNLFPLLRELRVPIMAYSPIEQGRILGHPVLREIAQLHHATPAQIALAWVLRRDDVCAIPRASRLEHTNENRAAADIQLDRADLSQLDQDFPRPERVRPLEML
jgi:diketogulonate reductase-like aldo/keto reductase